MNDKSKILYDTIHDKLKDESERCLSVIEYEIQKCIKEKMAVDFEKLSIGLETDIEDTLCIYEGTTYKKSVVYHTILKVINNLTKGER
jgi:hypothetical protein